MIFLVNCQCAPVQDIAPMHRICPFSKQPNNIMLLLNLVENWRSRPLTPWTSTQAQKQVTTKRWNYRAKGIEITWNRLEIISESWRYSGRPSETNANFHCSEQTEKKEFIQSYYWKPKSLFATARNTRLKQLFRVTRH